MFTHLRRHCREQRGVAALETLIMVGVLLIIAASAIEMAIYVFKVHQVQIAVDTTLKIMEKDGGYSAAAQQNLAAVLQDGGIDPRQVTVTATPPGQPYGTSLLLTVTYVHPMQTYAPTGASAIGVSIVDRGHVISEYVP